MKYTIQKLETKTTTTGKTMHKVSLGGVDGIVTLWGSDWPSVSLNQEVDGDLVPAKDPKFGPTLYPAKVPSNSSGRGNFAIKQAQETKRMDIAQAQENKHEAIKMAGAQRDAVLIVTTFYKDTMLDDSEIKEKIVSWSKFFLDDLGSQPF